jgi:hypothetical protein
LQQAALFFPILPTSHLNGQALSILFQGEIVVVRLQSGFYPIFIKGKMFNI